MVDKGNVPALAETPGNWVQDPEECGERATHQKGALDVAAEGLGVNASFPGELEDNIEESDAAYGCVLVNHMTCYRKGE